MKIIIMSDNLKNQNSRNVSCIASKVRYRMTSEQWKLNENLDNDQLSKIKEIQKTDDPEGIDGTYLESSQELELLEYKHEMESRGDEDTYTVRSLNEGWNCTWSLCDHQNLPSWMQDNEYLITGHRPPLYSYAACVRSIFRIHTETGNIWSHLLGCIMFVILAVLFLSKTTSLQDKLVFTPFFVGAVLCLGFSFIFHMVSCHSLSAINLFSRLDYCGISLLITGSFIPWLYYAFYYQFWLKVIYTTFVFMLGISATIISLWDKFGQPEYRQYRATVFTMFGLSSVIPAVHWVVLEGWENLIKFGAPLIITGGIYILGATLYAFRLPERVLPGKCDIWFHSHQIFHVLVVIATFINYCGLTSIAYYRQSVPNHCS